MEQKFLRCEHCGNVMAVVTDAGVPMMCCGQKMTELIPGVVEASREKHIPECSFEDGKLKVFVGSVAHPMAPEHYIEWICVQTKKGFAVKRLEPGKEPKACFKICDCDEVEAVYAYCNLHGLWKK